MSDEHGKENLPRTNDSALVGACVPSVSSVCDAPAPSLCAGNAGDEIPVAGEDRITPLLIRDSDDRISDRDERKLRRVDVLLVGRSTLALAVALAGTQPALL